MHVADVDDAGAGAQEAAGLGHDGGGVGVVENPGVGSQAADVVDGLNHVHAGAQAVGHAARAAGLLADHAHA